MENKMREIKIEKITLNIGVGGPGDKFDKNGNFSFGINEYINIQGIEYEIDIGIIGLEAAVTLTRPGYRIKRRLIKNKISKKHQITKEEGINFVKSYFNVKTEEGGEE